MATVQAANAYVISIEYDPAGQWCDMWDNHVIAWDVPDSGANPQPVVIGELPREVVSDPAKPDPVKSPQWVQVIGKFAIVPNLWRGELEDLWGWLATNNGASRQLRGNFIYDDALNSFANWANDNPTMVWQGP